MDLQLDECAILLNKLEHMNLKNMKAGINDFCGAFLKVFNLIEKMFNSYGDINENCSKENILAYIIQIVSLIRYMEQVINFKTVNKFTFCSCRQYFLKHIKICLEEITGFISLWIKNETSTPLTYENFSKDMDNILDMISIYNTDTNPGSIEVSTEIAEIINHNGRISINELLSQVLTFSEAVTPNDKMILTLYSEKVLKNFFSFEKEANFFMNSNYSRSNMMMLAGNSLESSLYKLEDYLHESILRTTYEVFSDHPRIYIENIKNLIESGSEENKIKNAIKNFDIYTDRVIQIGLFAVSFIGDIKVKAKLKSHLLSLQTLDSYLIPSLRLKEDKSFIFLAQHYYNEWQRFEEILGKEMNIESFCECYIQILTDFIQKYENSCTQLNMNEILNMALVLQKNIYFNFDKLCLHQNISKRNIFENFECMIKECFAVHKKFNNIDKDRKLKRLKVLRSCTKKLIHLFNESNINSSELSKKENRVSLELNSDLLRSHNLLESYGIKSFKRSIICSTKDRKSTSSVNEICSSAMKTRHLKKRNSLRIAMFKKNISYQASKTESNKNSTTLDLTCILEQLTELSNTFS